MLKKIIKPVAIPILNLIYKMKKKIYFSLRLKNILNTMKKLDINNIEKFNEQNWHHGYCYFIGKFNNKKVFIKVDTKLKILINEKTFYDVMGESLKKYLVPMELFYEDEYLQVVIFEFLNNYKELDEKKLKDDFNYLDDIYFILEEMKNKKVIHRDIKLNNFMIFDDKLKIIDFTFSNSLDKYSDFKELDISKKENILILRTLGMGLHPEPFCWNDSLSLISQIKNSTNQKITNYIDKFEKLSKNNYYILSDLHDNN